MVTSRGDFSMKRGTGRGSLVVAVALLAFAGGVVAQGMQPASPARPAAGGPVAVEPMKVVVQVSDEDPRTWNLALNNVRNLQRGIGAENVVAELVVYGPGIAMLQAGSSVEARIAQASRDGVNVVACENTMRGRKLTPADMIPGIGYVPSGVIEIVQRERDGYSYLRP
jgi:intracellular sulfur oxidation DsrE/DsrF family protein